MAVTRMVVNTVRYETLAYEFDGALTEEQALEALEDGTHDPTWSKIRQEDVDVVTHEVVE